MGKLEHILSAKEAYELHKLNKNKVLGKKIHQACLNGLRHILYQASSKEIEELTELGYHLHYDKGFESEEVICTISW